MAVVEGVLSFHLEARKGADWGETGLTAGASLGASLWGHPLYTWQCWGSNCTGATGNMYWWGHWLWPQYKASSQKVSRRLAVLQTRNFHAASWLGQWALTSSIWVFVRPCRWGGEESLQTITIMSLKCEI